MSENAVVENYDDSEDHEDAQVDTSITCALLDERGVFLGMVTLPDDSHLTERHLPSITACDLPPGQYRWVPDAQNPYGGAFWALKTLARQAESAELLKL